MLKKVKRNFAEQENSCPAIVREFRKFKTVEDLLQDAKSNGTKGDIRSYNGYKNELSRFILSSSEYEQAIRKLSQILRV